MASLVANLAILAACAALYGRGRAVRRLTALPACTWPVTIVFGLAALIFLGGILNLVCLAYPAMLDAAAR
jgi:hypothetical protein